jgi:hypothetical protein
VLFGVLSADKTVSKAIDKVVKLAARLVLNKKRSDLVREELTESLSWLLPKFLYKKSLMCSMYKLIRNSNSPEYFRDLITYSGEIRRHDKRSRDELHVPLQHKTNYGSKTFVHSAFKLWNFYLMNQPDLLTLGYTSYSWNMNKLLLANQLRPS